MSFSYANIPDAALEEAVEAEFGDSSFALDKKSQYYNFICPFCGDPARPNKKKAYVYRDRWLFRCYKCGQSMHFMKYLKENNDAAYKRMLLFGFDGDRSDEKREEVLPKKKVDLPNKPWRFAKAAVSVRKCMTFGSYAKKANSS